MWGALVVAHIGARRFGGVLFLGGRRFWRPPSLRLVLFGGAGGAPPRPGRRSGPVVPSGGRRGASPGAVFFAVFWLSAAQQIKSWHHPARPVRRALVTALYVSCCWYRCGGCSLGGGRGSNWGICACISLAGLLPAVPVGARYRNSDRRRGCCCSAFAAVCVPGYAGGSLASPRLDG